RESDSGRGAPVGEPLEQIEPERMAFGGCIAEADGVDCADHAAVALEEAIADRDDALSRLRGTRRTPDVPGNLHFVTLRIERAGGHIGAGGRPAYSRETVHHHRGLAIPCSDEIDQLLHMFMRRRGVAVHWHCDVVDGNHQMVFRCDVVRPLYPAN